MKKCILYLLAIASTLSGYTQSCSQPLVEFKMGYLFFLNSKMQKVYHKGSLDTQLCASCPLWNLSNRWTLNAYGAVEYFEGSGKSINGDQRTSFWSVPINIGLKPVYTITQNLQYHFTIGPRYLYIHQHNRSRYVNRNISGNGFGYFVNTGFNYFICNFVIDIFGEYSSANTHFPKKRSRVYSKNIQIESFTVGGGMGYNF